MKNDTTEAVLEELGLEPQWRGRYWTIHCPQHDDANKSAVCFEDNWIHCFAGCPRIHLNKLAGRQVVPYTHDESKPPACTCDFTDFWLDLQPLPQDGDVKGIPNNVLNRLGWRNWEGGFGYPPGVFIPYFNTSRTKVPFFQIRHNDENRRFSFAKGCTPICYGLECLPKMEKYLVWTEGSRDSVILRMCGVPAISIPSASSGAMLKRMEKYASEHNLTVVCVGDRDEAGDKLIKNLSGFYLDARTPIGKDVGDFYAERGLAAVKETYNAYRITTQN